MVYESASMKSFLYKKLWLQLLKEHLVVTLCGNVVAVLQPVLIAMLMCSNQALNLVLFIVCLSFKK